MQINALLACGGLAKNKLYIQEHADITGKSLSPKHIYRVRLWYFANDKTSRASHLYLKFQSPNSRSKLLNMISILKYIWISNFIFF
jgi:hypothetical protein